MLVAAEAPRQRLQARLGLRLALLQVQVLVLVLALGQSSLCQAILLLPQLRWPLLPLRLLLQARLAAFLTPYTSSSCSSSSCSTCNTRR